MQSVRDRFEKLGRATPSVVRRNVYLNVILKKNVDARTDFFHPRLGAHRVFHVCNRGVISVNTTVPFASIQDFVPVENDNAFRASVRDRGEVAREPFEVTQVRFVQTCAENDFFVLFAQTRE